MDKQKIIGIVVIVVVAVAAYLLVKQPMRDSGTLSERELDKISISMVDYFPEAQGYFVKPKDDVIRPGVIMVHDWWGLNDDVKSAANQLALEGYNVIAVDLFNKAVNRPVEARTLPAALNQETAFNNLRSALDYLREHASEKIAVLGWGFGGGKAMQFSVSGLPLSATVVYYGDPITDEQKLTAIKGPVLGFFGDQDTVVPVETAKQFDSALDKLGVVNEIYFYSAGHAFANPLDEKYASRDAKNAWDKTLAFLNKHLK